MPGLKVVAPASPADAKGLLTAAIRDDDPVLVLEYLAQYNTKGEIPDSEHTIPIGTATVVKSASDVTVVAHSLAAAIALERRPPGRANLPIVVLDALMPRPSTWSSTAEAPWSGRWRATGATTP